MLNCLFSFLSAEILSNLGSPHSVHEDAEKPPQADVKEGKNSVAAWIPPNCLADLWKKLLLLVFNLRF